MKIIEVNIPSGISRIIGLKPISMSRLGNIVLIAGRNGSGKTRLLELIKGQAANIQTLTKIKENESVIEAHKAGVKSQRDQIGRLNFQIQEQKNKGLSVPSDIIKQKAQKEEAIKKYTKKINRAQNYINWSILKVDQFQERYTLVDYVPKTLNLEDSAAMNPKQILEKVEASMQFGVNHLAQTTLSKIQSICTRFSNATNERLSVKFSESEIKKALQNYAKLQEYISTYLNTEIQINIDGLAELYGLPIGRSKLSDGQKILLQYCIVLFDQEAQIDNNILILDEPENHLHPEILLSTIDKIIQANKHGQIWIATHSINVLAHFYEKDIWFMEDGDISFKGRKPELVLKSLLGDDDEIEKLHQFLSMPSIFATNQYAFESLKHPLSILTGINDPQSYQIFDLINKLNESNKKLKLLDFGAGKGRLLKSMADLSIEHNIKIDDWLDYYAFDKYDVDKEDCSALIYNLYDDDNRYFNDETEMISKLELESFDVIILVNVLHEISPQNWNDLFNRSSTINSFLKADGKVIIVEDQIVPNGEKAYTEGFIVFDVPEFKKLFKLNKYDFEEALDGRLKAHIFNKEDIQKFSIDSLKDALLSMFLRSKKEVEDIRGKKTSYKNGMVHGFWVQQLANTFLIMEKMGIEIKP